MTLRLGQHMPHEGDIQQAVYPTPSSDSRGYSHCIVNIPKPYVGLWMVTLSMITGSSALPPRPPGSSLAVGIKTI